MKPLFSGAVAVGAAAPNGLDCELEIAGISGLEFVLFEFPRLHTAADWLHNDTPGGEVALLRWAVLAVPQDQILQFQLALRKSPNIDWAKLAGQAAVRCFHRKENFRESS